MTEFGVFNDEGCVITMDDMTTDLDRWTDDGGPTREATS